MPKILLDNGCLILSIRQLLKKPNGSLFYQRRIPADLKLHYGNRHRILESLKTRSLPEAAKRIKVLAKRDDSLWTTMVSSGGELAPPVIKHKALELLKSWGFTPGEPPQHGEDFSDKMLDR